VVAGLGAANAREPSIAKSNPNALSVREKRDGMKLLQLAAERASQLNRRK
jgi:hypothetical protein